MNGSDLPMTDSQAGSLCSPGAGYLDSGTNRLAQGIGLLDVKMDLFNGGLPEIFIVFKTQIFFPVPEEMDGAA